MQRRRFNFRDQFAGEGANNGTRTEGTLPGTPVPEFKEGSKGLCQVSFRHYAPSQVTRSVWRRRDADALLCRSLECSLCSSSHVGVKRGCSPNQASVQTPCFLVSDTILKIEFRNVVGEFVAAQSLAYRSGSASLGPCMLNRSMLLLCRRRTEVSLARISISSAQSGFLDCRIFVLVVVLSVARCATAQHCDLKCWFVEAPS